MDDKSNTTSNSNQPTPIWSKMDQLKEFESEIISLKSKLTPTSSSQNLVDVARLAYTDLNTQIQAALNLLIERKVLPPTTSQLFEKLDHELTSTPRVTSKRCLKTDEYDCPLTATPVRRELKFERMESLSMSPTLRDFGVSQFGLRMIQDESVYPSNSR